jgi:hypothetical protein
MNATLLTRLLTHLFGKPEEINGGNRCPTYLYRWAILPRWLSSRIGKVNVYLHRFVGDDWALDLHDHPKRFISIGLWGSYVEHTTWPADGERFLSSVDDHRRVVYRAPWFRTFPARHIHRLTGPTPDRPCWTLVIVGREVRSWGFWNLGQFIPWKRYVTSSTADERKACP